MTRLLDTSFVMVVRDYCEHKGQMPAGGIRELYCEFRKTLTRFVESSSPVIDQLRILKATHVELEQLKEMVLQDEEIRDSDTRRCLCKAILHLEIETEIAMLTIEYPDIRKRTEKVAVSPIFWNEEYSLTDLIELLTALCESGALKDRFGRRASMASIVRLTEVAFNIKLPDARALKANVLNRKINLFHFLDILKKALKDLSEK